MSRQSASQSIAELITELYQTTGDIPPPLIGATTTLVNEHLYLFGGRLPKTKRVSNTLFRLHLPTKVWTHLDLQSSTCTAQAPTPRYFHSASHYDNYILFYGGMTISAETGELKTLDDLVFLDIESLSWEYPNLSDVPSARYAHVATLTNHRLVIVGGQNIQHHYLTDIQIFDCKKRKWCQEIVTQEQYGAYRSTAAASTPIRLMSFGPTAMDEALESHQNDDIAITIHCYSNHSSTADKNHQFSCFKLNTRNQLVNQEDLTEKCSSRQFSLPPLRFPTSFMCGQQMIIAGPHLSDTSQQFHIWALDVNHFSWTRIEPGPVLSKGAWLHSALCHNSNRMIVFGHPGRSLTEDYRDRIHTFEFMACVDIEVFGIYRPPKMSYSASGQELGLKLLNDPILSDLRIVTTDNQSMDVNSVVLAQRWPSIKHLLSPLINPSSCSAQEIADNQNIKRELKFPDTHQVLVAFLQFIYTDHLLTAQQNQPHILARLLLIANLFEIPRLKELATHTLHQMLNMSTAPMIYESASLSNAVSLQIRALRVMIKARKMRQMHPPERSFTSPTPPSVVRTLPSSLSASPRPVEVLSRQQSELNHFSSSDYNMRRISQSTPSLSISHSRSSSQRSLSTDSDTSSPNMNNIKPTKMANFFNRPSPIYEQPPVKNSPSKSTGMFWTKKKANDYFSRPTRSETTKMGSFNFLSSH